MKRAFLVAGQGDQSFVKFLQFAPENPAFALGRAKLGAGDHPAQVLVAGPVHDQDRQHGAVFQRQFAADEGTQAVFLRGLV